MAGFCSSIIATLKTVRYTNYISINFDKRRIKEFGKLSVVGTQSNLGLILKHIRVLSEVQVLNVSQLNVTL